MSDADALADQLAALKADNARLRRLLDEAGLHDGLRHAFRDTVAILRELMRRTVETVPDVESYAAHLEGRLDAIVRIRSRADAFGEVDLHSLVSDELAVHLVYEGDRANLRGPGLRLRPKAAQVFAMAIHELATNAVQHGHLGGQDGRLDVTWTIEVDEGRAMLVLDWKESGGAQPAEPTRRGFGTTVLEEMLAYDLAARTTLTFEPDGLRCIVRLPMSERLGRILPDEGEGVGR